MSRKHHSSSILFTLPLFSKDNFRQSTESTIYDYQHLLFSISVAGINEQKEINRWTNKYTWESDLNVINDDIKRNKPPF